MRDKNMSQTTGQQAVSMLLDAVKKEDYTAIEVAKELLVKIGQPSVKPLTTALLNNPKILLYIYDIFSKRVSEAFVIVLRTLDDKIIYSSVQQFEQVVFAGSNCVESLIYQIMLKLLSQVRDESTVKYLVEIVKTFKDVNCGVVYAAACSLGEIGKIEIEDIEILIRSLKWCNGTGVGVLYGTLRKFGDLTRTTVINGINSDDEELRECASFALAWLIQWGGYKQDLPLLLVSVDAPLIHCRIVGIISLGELGKPELLPILEKIEQVDITKRTYQGMTVRTAALQAIKLIKEIQENKI